jgi:hypothetical protein
MEANFVLVGSSGESALMRVLLGSTARSVLRHAPCCVEIVRPPAKRAKSGRQLRVRVLIAAGGSEFSLAALRFGGKSSLADGKHVQGDRDSRAVYASGPISL